MSGKGDYQSIMKGMKKLARGALTSGGAMAGSAFGGYAAGAPGSAAGGAAGRRLGAKISKMIGSGDYAVSADCGYNSLVKPGASQYASFADSTTSVRLKHREYLQDAFSGDQLNTFNNTVFEINPGLSSTFPFLAQIASNFEEYKMHGLVFEYVSTTSPYSSTLAAGGAMGSCIMAMEYNAASAPFTSKPQMENSDFAISARPDKSMLYGVECADNATNHLFVRTGTTNLPLTSTDIGLFNFATLTPLPVNTTLGEIWVTYDVELFRPKISPLRFGYFHTCLSLPAATAAGSILAGDYSIVRGAYTPVSPIASGSATDFFLSPTATTITLAGADVGDVYMVLFTYNSPITQAVQNVTFSSSAGLVGLNVFGNYTAASRLAESTSTETNAMISVIVQVTSIQTVQTITASLANVVPAGGAIVDIVLVNIGNGFTAATL